jgi:hypothetical protein
MSDISSSEQESSESEYDLSSDEEVEEESNDKMNINITQKGVKTFYNELLEDNNVLLTPEYQRELSWNIEKMIGFIDTIYKGWIVPNFVIYELSENECKKVKEYNYEMLDGQHRSLAIKMFIEGTNHANYDNEKFIFINHNNERIYYNMDATWLKKMSKTKKCRNMTKEEKKNFDNFQMSFHYIKSTTKNGLSMKLKCDLFNRLQNGERVESYVKVKNLDTPITNFIRSNKSLAKLTQLDLISKINLNKKTKLKHDESFYLYFLIRCILIADKKSLEINYLDLNISKYLQHNYKSIRLKNDVKELYEKVMIFINWFVENDNIDNKIIPELCYILMCFYINYDLDKVDKIIKYIFSKKKYYEMYNDTKKYKKIVAGESFKSKITNEEKMTEIYEVLDDFDL